MLSCTPHPYSHLQLNYYKFSRSQVPKDYSTDLKASNERKRLPRQLSGKESACQSGDRSLIPGSGRHPGEGNGNLLQYSCLGNPMDRAGGLPTMGSQKCQTQLSKRTTRMKETQNRREREKPHSSTISLHQSHQEDSLNTGSWEGNQAQSF